MLKKLSLAALIAMGSMSVASATPLTEAIKNVNFGGYTYIRIYNDKASGQDAVNRYRTQALFKFSVPVSEELKFNTAYAFDWNIYSGANTSGSSTPTNVKFFLQYSANNLTALVGKIPVATPITGTSVGEATAAGAVALYKVSDNLTVAAAALDAVVNLDMAQANGAAIPGMTYNATSKLYSTGENTYAVAAIYNQDNISAQAWFFTVNDIIDSDIVVMATYKADNVAVHADFATASLDDSISKDTQTYFNVSAKYSQDALCAKIGYVKTGKDGGIVVLDGDSPLAAVLPTPQKTNIANTTDDYAYYAKLGYKVDPKTNVYLAYSDADKAFDNEIAVGGSYQYTKKMKISAYYSVLSAATDNNQARVEFKYSF
jgi:hypothetical protein